jgi:hypothetical protein
MKVSDCCCPVDDTMSLGLLWVLAVWKLDRENTP